MESTLMMRGKRRVSLVVPIALIVASCGTGGGGVTETTQASDAPAGAEQTSAEQPSGLITVAETELGEILVDHAGRTVYLFTRDGPGESTCSGDCTELWPPVPGNTSIGEGLDAELFSVVQRDDGTTQLAIGRSPLYLYAPDEPGEIGGHGFNDVWFAVTPEGEAVQDEEPAPADDALDYGY